MTREKKFKATITDKLLFEDLIWMSYRYCIGRKSIAACMHADNLVTIVDNLSPERKEFMAKDIRGEMNQKLNWKNNITINGYDNNYDGYSCLYKYLKDHPEITDDTEYHFYINVDTGEVDAEKEDKKDGKYYESVFNEYIDMVGWIKLAAYLDSKRFKVTTKYEGKTEEHNCIEYVNVFQKDIRILYVSEEKYKNSPYTTSYIAPEYIIKIEK